MYAYLLGSLYHLFRLYTKEVGHLVRDRQPINTCETQFYYFLKDLCTPCSFRFVENFAESRPSGMRCSVSSEGSCARLKSFKILFLSFLLSELRKGAKIEFITSHERSTMEIPEVLSSLRGRLNMGWRCCVVCGCVCADGCVCSANGEN